MKTNQTFVGLICNLSKLLLRNWLNSIQIIPERAAGTFFVCFSQTSTIIRWNIQWCKHFWCAPHPIVSLDMDRSNQAAIKINIRGRSQWNATENNFNDVQLVG